MAAVLVTGAGGFIGSEVVRCLEARALPATRDGRGGTRRLDLRDPGSMAAALDGAEAVIHCAVGDRAVTVDGTRALLDAAAAAGVRRFVHLSSVAVYGAATGETGEDSATVAHGGDGYAAWKAAAEAACLEPRPPMTVVRLRPAIVYGPGSALWVDGLARRIRSGRWGTFGTLGEGTCNLVHVADVAAAAVLAVDADADGAFNISGDDPPDWNGWFTRLATAIGGPALRPLSPATIRRRVALSLPLKAARRVVPGLGSQWLLGAPARSELALYSQRVAYPTARAHTALGWTPRVGIADGLAGCLPHLRAQGLTA